MSLQKGDRVRMTAELREIFGGVCKKNGKHTLNDDPEMCLCSWEHEQEFGEAIGEVGELADYGNGILGPELEVFWEPDHLRYHYLPEHLEKVS